MDGTVKREASRRVAHILGAEAGMAGSSRGKGVGWTVAGERGVGRALRDR